MSFNRPSPPPDRAAPGRGKPKLWAEGSQQPRFDLRAFARVSLALSRRTACPALGWTSGVLRAAAGGMAQNTLRPRLAAMGRVGRALPSRRGLALGLTQVSALLATAAEVAVPPPPLPEPPAYPDLMPTALARRPRRPAPPPAAPEAAPEPPPRPAAEADFDAPTLAAIRALIDDMRDGPPPLRPDPTAEPAPSGRTLLTHAVPLTPPEPRDPTLAETLTARMFHLAAAGVAWGVTALALPIGMTRALLVHLNGQDLRTWG